MFGHRGFESAKRDGVRVDNHHRAVAPDDRPGSSPVLAAGASPHHDSERCGLAQKTHSPAQSGKAQRSANRSESLAFMGGCKSPDLLQDCASPTQKWKITSPEMTVSVRRLGATPSFALPLTESPLEW